MVRGYKGFGKDLKCRGFQYEVGGKYVEPGAKVCDEGFHFCEEPFDVFSYYPPTDSRYCEVEGDGEIDRDGNDSKVATSKLHIRAEIGLKGLIEAGVKFILDRVDLNNNKKSNTGDRSAATNTGYQSAATNTGYQSAATNTGDRSAATNTGDQSAATVEGEESVAMATGYENKARGALGCWIVLAEWAEDEKSEYHIIDVQCARVDGQKIRANTFYRLSGGEFVECGEVSQA